MPVLPANLKIADVIEATGEVFELPPLVRVLVRDEPASLLLSGALDRLEAAASKAVYATTAGQEQVALFDLVEPAGNARRLLARLGLRP